MVRNIELKTFVVLAAAERQKDEPFYNELSIHAHNIVNHYLLIIISP